MAMRRFSWRNYYAYPHTDAPLGSLPFLSTAKWPTLVHSSALGHMATWPLGHLATWPLGLTLPVRGHKPKSLVCTGPESRSNCQKKGTESKWGAGPAKSVNRQFQLFYRLRTEWPNEPGQMSMPSVYVRMEITVGKLFQKNTVLSLKNDICNNIYLKTNIKHDCFPLKE